MKKRKIITVILLVLIGLTTPYIIYFSSDRSEIPREIQLEQLRNAFPKHELTNFVYSKTFFVPKATSKNDDKLEITGAFLWILAVGWAIGAVAATFNVIYEENSGKSDKFFMFPLHYIGLTLINIMFPLIIAIIFHVFVPYLMLKLLYFIGLMIVLIAATPEDERSILGISYAFIDYIIKKAENKHTVLKYKEQYNKFLGSQKDLMKKYNAYE